MTARRLATRRIAKPWGRHDLLPAFGTVDAGEEPVGEIWFEDERGGDPELLVKYLFTSEKLSIQVHPDDAAARAAGYPRGKEEAWLVLDADEDATIGIGLKQESDAASLRAAALDGSIEELMDWRPAKAGDYYYSPAGTVHALGPGLKLIEVQQNVDLTYRLYDYGRPRELHLDEGIAVSHATPYYPPFEPYRIDDKRQVLAEGRKFVLERWRGAVDGTIGEDGLDIWLVPVSGAGQLDGEPLSAGSVWIVEGPSRLALDEGGDLLIAYVRQSAAQDLIRR